jgi:hypothetical protein
MRRTQAMALLAGLLGACLLLVAPPASAQTGYPPGLCTTTSGVQFVGTVEIGQRFVVQLAPTCLFTPGTPITVTVNGVDIPGKTADENGVVLVDVTVVSATELSIDDPVITPAICGTNSVVARGASSTAQGGTSTQTATFTVNCPSVPVTTAPVQGGVLSRTGASSVRIAAVALALMSAGSLAVVATRRRRAA